MSRAIFIARLKEGLVGLPQAEINEIVLDYDFHFDEAISTGHSEDEIVAKLGDPARLARELRGGTEQRHSGEAGAVSPSTLAAPVARTRGKLWWLLAPLLVIGAAAAVYLVEHEGGSAFAPPAKTQASPRETQQQPTAGPAIANRILISAGETVDLGTITQDRVEFGIDGGGHAKAKGRVKELILHIDGSGSAEFGDLFADTVRVDLAGTGSAQVSGTLLADITISGSGTVVLKVKPKTLNQSIFGTGRVITQDSSH